LVRRRSYLDQRRPDLSVDLCHIMLRQMRQRRDPRRHGQHACADRPQHARHYSASAAASTNSPRSLVVLTSAISARAAASRPRSFVAFNGAAPRRWFGHLCNS
jgi:hypothetical protein